jgi:hypothetical protein
MTTKPRNIRILTIRDQKVVLDSDLAAVYGVTTKRPNEQLRRNRQRFPDDFAFQLTADEFEFLRSQTATLKPGRGQYRKYPPWAFHMNLEGDCDQQGDQRHRAEHCTGDMRVFPPIAQPSPHPFIMKILLDLAFQGIEREEFTAKIFELRVSQPKPIYWMSDHPVHSMHRGKAD